MKQNIRRRLLPVLFVLFAVVSIFPTRVYAVSGNVYFTPDGGQVRMGDTITVEVRGNVPDPGLWGGGATIVVNYDPSKLELLSRNDSGGAFRGANSRDWDGTKAGTVRYVAYYAINAPGVKGTKIIGMEFRAIGTGSTQMSFGSVNVNNGPTTGTPSTFSIIPLTCPAGQVGTPPNCSTPPPPTPKPTPKPTTPSTPTKPITPAPIVASDPPITDSTESTPDPEVASDGGLKIEDVKATTTRQKNSVSWKLNRDDITPTIAYGLSKSAATKSAEVKSLEDGSYESEFADLKPGTLYYFTIKAASSDSLQGATHSGTFTTRGYPVQLTIQQNGVLAPGAKVTIGQRNFVANKDAIIVTELGEGNFNATIRPAGATTSYPVSFAVAKKTIPSNGNPALQSFTLNAIIDGASSDENDNILLAIGGVIAGLGLLGGIIGFLIYKRKQRDQQDDSTVDQDLLIANYGESLEAYRESAVNTPTPNLDATAYQVASQPLQPEQVNDSEASQLSPTEVTPLQASQSQPLTDAETTAPVATDQSPPFDPTTLPLPPQEPPQGSPQTTTDLQGVVDLPQYTDDEQISPELAQIESLQVPETDDEPSAIYDAATGELDIIHHQPGTAPTNAPSFTSPTPPTSQTIDDPSELAIHPEPTSPNQPLSTVAQQ